MRYLPFLAVFVLLCACSEKEVSGAGAPDTGAPDTGALADSGIAPRCAPDNLGACAYVPDRPSSSLASTIGPSEVSYRDVTGATRTFGYEARIPEGADSSTPIVIWSHGGASGKDDPTRVATGFGEIAVAAGYIVIAIAHYPRPFETYESLCRDIGQTTEQCQGGACRSNDECSSFGGGSCVENQCRYFKPLNWDRPNDFAALMDAITAADGPLGSRGDTSRVVYAGHSAGAGSALMVAGAGRQYGDETHLLLDERPIAFISGSPQGSEDDGFTAQSYTGELCRMSAPDSAGCLTRPHLVLTGAGDDTTGTRAEDRRAAYTQLPEGDKYILWNTEEAARHTVFEFNPDSCEGYDGPGAVDAARCQTYVRWLESAAIAFLDAYTRGDASAQAYLAGDNLVILSKGAVDWESK